MMLKRMLEAIDAQDLGLIRQLAKDGFELNKIYDSKTEQGPEFGQTLLAHAAFCGYRDVVECLLDLGADIKLDEFDILRSAGCHPDILRLLISRGADVKVKVNDNGWNLLIDLIQDGHCGGERGIEIIDILIKAGLSINYRDEDMGYSALHHALQFIDLNVIDALVHVYGAASDLLGLNVGLAPLHLALIEQKFSVAEIMINSRINVNVKDADDGMTPLHYAVFPVRKLNAPVGEELQMKIVKLLLERGAYPDPRDNNNFTPLTKVCLRSERYLKKYHPHGAMPMIKLLMEYGADPRVEIGLNPVEPLPARVLRNENKNVSDEVLEFFRSLK